MRAHSGPPTLTLKKIWKFFDLHWKKHSNLRVYSDLKRRIISFQGRDLVSACKPRIKDYRI